MILDRATRLFRKKPKPADTRPPAEPPVSPPPVTPSQKDADRLNRWLTLGANIGVLLGLIVLIVEVRQNAALTRAAMEQQKNSFLAEIELNIVKPELSDVWVKSVRHPEALTDTELRMMDGILVALMLQWEQRFLMADAGLATRADARAHVVNAAPFYFGSRFGKHWWSLQASGWEGTEMIETADPVVQALDEDFLAHYLDSLRLEADVPTPPEPEADAP